jgi:NAD(P)-dependent dehydrogenase (short-subunit alcohol dehydrogenase family)
VDIISLFRLDGEKAIVTGAGRGLGREVALGLAEAGADVAVIDKEKQGADETVLKVKDLGREAIAVESDVTQEEDVKRSVQIVKENFGKIDILVCNAGIAIESAAEEMDKEVWQKVMDVNLNGVFFYCKWVGKEMIKNKKGSIINVASMSAYVTNTPQKQCNYNSSKAGVIQLTKSLAYEWAPYNVRVNVVSPGYIMTPLLKTLDSSFLDKWISYTPQKRIADPSEFKGIFIFLASQAASYFTGSSIIADGGYTLW